MNNMKKDIDLGEYNGAALHGINKNGIPQGESHPEKVVSVSLDGIPEDVVNNKIVPLIGELTDISSKYNVYFWITRMYTKQEDITE